MIDSLNSPLAQSIALTLLHFLWQGILIALIYAAVLAALGDCSLRTRHAVSLLAFAALSIAPLVTLGWCWTQTKPVADSPPLVISEAVAPSATVEGPPTNIPAHTSWAPSDLEPASSTRHESHSALLPSEPSAEPVRIADWEWSDLQPLIVLVWLSGVMLCGARLAGGLLNLYWLRIGRVPVAGPLAERSRRIAAHMGLDVVRLYCSERIREAAAVGFFRPVVLVPTSWLTALPVETLEAVIAHELAHIRRYDAWVNLLQRITETLLFYHPAVWWLSNRLRLDREMCCDERAVEATGSRGAYAIALERVGQLQVHGTPTLASAITGDGRMKLLNRIQHVLGSAPKPRREPAWVIGMVAVAIPLLVLGFGENSSLVNKADAQEREKARSAEQDAPRRRSPEADAPPRRSPERDADRRESPERRDGDRDRDERREGDRDRDRDRDRGREDEPRRDGDRELRIIRDREGGREQGAGRFQPQTIRERALLERIEQLQRELNELRQQIRTRSGDDFRPDRFPRDRAESGFEPRSRERETARDWQHKAEQVFRAHDKNRNGFVELEEWLSMTNGTATAERREIQTKRFLEARPGEDKRLSFHEFAESWARQHRSALGRRDGEGADRIRRDGERREVERRDGDRREVERRDGDRRDGERREVERRDGERREVERRDGDRREVERREVERREVERREKERPDGERKEREGDSPERD